MLWSIPYHSGQTCQQKKRNKKPLVFGSGAFLPCRVRNIVHFKPAEHHKSMSEDRWDTQKRPSIIDGLLLVRDIWEACAIDQSSNKEQATKHSDKGLFHIKGKTASTLSTCWRGLSCPKIESKNKKTFFKSTSTTGVITKSLGGGYV